VNLILKILKYNDNKSHQEPNTSEADESLITQRILQSHMSSQIRPTGVTILAILEIISGAIAIGIGISFSALWGSMGMGMMGDAGGGAIISIIGGITVVLGVISFVMAWGLLKGKPWAWTITLILTIISLIFDLPLMNIIGLIIDIVILYYLFRPHVKAYFGKSAQIL